MARKLIKRLGKQQLALGVKTDVTALYMRVSTDLQANEGNSLEAQREKLQAHCTGKGWTVTDKYIYVDAGLSGKSTDKRPAFQAMLKAAADGEINRIVVTKRDRFARNTIDFLTKLDELRNIGCALVCLDFDFDSSTPTGRLISTVFASFAEWEASLITERVMSGKVQNASKGGYNGARCPLGYEYANGVFTLSDQATTIKTIFDMFVAGNSLSSISSHLNSIGAPTAKGGKWYAATVRYILLNGFYAGISQWDGQEDRPGEHPAIIDEATYKAASHRLDMLPKGGPQPKVKVVS